MSGPADPIDLVKADERRLRTVRWNHLAYLPQGSMNSLNPVMKVQDQFVDVMQLHLTDMDQKQMAAKVPELLGAGGPRPCCGADVRSRAVGRDEAAGDHGPGGGAAARPADRR